MREVLIWCNTRWGMQACLEKQVRFRLVLSDALILQIDDEKKLEKWKKYYQTLQQWSSPRWTREQWEEQGFILVDTKHHHGGRTTRYVPHLKGET